MSDGARPLFYFRRRTLFFMHTLIFSRFHSTLFFCQEICTMYSILLTCTMYCILVTTASYSDPADVISFLPKLYDQTSDKNSECKKNSTLAYTLIYCSMSVNMYFILPNATSAQLYSFPFSGQNRSLMDANLSQHPTRFISTLYSATSTCTRRSFAGFCIVTIHLRHDIVYLSSLGKTEILRYVFNN